MQTHGRFKYAESTNLDAKLLELPFIKNRNSDEKASMIIILPAHQFKCNVTVWVERYLNWPSVVAAVESMKEENIQLTMPQFKIESEIELSEVLSSLGMAPAFSNSANFRKMVKSRGSNARLSKVLHKATVSTNILLDI